MNNIISIKVRGYHLDVYSHVNNARYLEFLEEGRWSLFDKELELWASIGISFFVVNINISYRKPAVLNSTLIIQSEISEIKSRSCILHQKINDSVTGELVVEADITFVIVGKSGKAMKLEGDILDNLKKFQLNNIANPI